MKLYVLKISKLKTKRNKIALFFLLLGLLTFLFQFPSFHIGETGAYPKMSSNNTILLDGNAELG